jgi:hypothetical protein
LYRHLKTELSRHPYDRISPVELIKISKDEYDRLIELSPLMPSKVINNFNNKFKNTKFSKPEICDNLNTVKVFEIDEKDRFPHNKENNKITKTKPKVNERKERFTNTFLQLNGRRPTADEIRNSMNKFENHNDTPIDSTESDNNDQHVINIDNVENKLLDTIIETNLDTVIETDLDTLIDQNINSDNNFADNSDNNSANNND